MHPVDHKIARDGKKKLLTLAAVHRTSGLREVERAVVASKMRPEHFEGFPQ